MKKRNFVSCCLTLAIWTAASQCAAANAIQPFSLDKARVAANRLEIKLPNSEKLAFDVKSSTRAGITTVTGQQGDNSLLITTDGRNTFGLITTAQTTYKIDTREQGVFLYDEREFYSKPIDGIASNFAEAQVLVKKIKSQNELKQTQSELLLPSHVDIALFFTPLVEEQIGVQGVRTKMQFLIDLTQEVIISSGVNVVLSPVFILRFDETLGANNNNDTTSFPADINGKEAITLSNLFGADLMHLLYIDSGQPFCGLSGGVLWQPPNNPVWGITGTGSCPETVFTHEIGHAFEAQHDRDDIADEFENQGGLTDYYYGYHCGGRGTIMNVTFDRTNRHHFFSSPNITFQGEPCGVPIGQPDAADNVTVFEVTRSLVENVNPPMAIHGNVSFTESTYLIDDERSVISVELKRTGDLSKEASIELATLDGSAEADVDFGHFLKRVEFAEGAATAQVEIEILNLQRTTDKDFRLVLRWPFQLEITGSDVIEVKLAKNVITLGQAQFSGALQSVAENAGAVALTVSRVNGSDGEITVNYQTQDGSAKAGTDYTAASGELVFAEGETSKTISIAILNNSTVDGSRSFSVNLSGNNLGATTSTNVTITDDDQTPQPPVDNGSSGGGSLGLGLLLLTWLGFLYRVKKKCLCFLCPFYRSNQPA